MAKGDGNPPSIRNKNIKKYNKAKKTKVSEKKKTKNKIKGIMGKRATKWKDVNPIT